MQDSGSCTTWISADKHLRIESFTYLSVMKHIQPIAGIVFLLLTASLFLPYKTQFDTSYGKLFPLTPVLPVQYISGLSIPATYPPVIASLLAAISLLIVRNTGTAIIGLVLSCVALLFLGYLAFFLTFELTFFGTPRNPKLGAGYFAALTITIGFVVLMIVHLVKTSRNGTKNTVREDVLDA